MYNSRPGGNDWTGYNRPNNWDGNKDWGKCHDCEWHNDKNDEYCCKNSMRIALELLSNPTVKDFIHFDRFAFLGDKFLAGTFLVKQINPNTCDNLVNNLSAKFKGFDNCNRDLVNIEATDLFYPIPAQCSDTADKIENFNAKNMSLCDLEAVAFSVNCGIENPLTRLLDKVYPRCNDESCECCCNDGIFNKVFAPNSPNIVNITAGWLVAKDAKVLGRVGNVLVLLNNQGDRVYLACLDTVGFIG